MINNSFSISNGKISAEFITYAGTLTSLKVPDRDGKMTEVLLGFDTLEEYKAQDKFIGALVGRYANRIAKGKFSLNGKEYTLPLNNGENHLHGGYEGYFSKEWTVIAKDEKSAVLGLFSPNMDEGYPGDLDVKVKYSLEDTSLVIEYEAVASEDTICNLTSHCYFNLSGDKTKKITEQYIKINAEKYTPTDVGSIPTGELADVEGTPLDLRKLTRIGEHIDDDFVQMKYAGGYDHNYVIDGEGFREAAVVYSKESGIKMTFSHDQVGMQFYSGNYLDDEEKRTGFCLESQAFPDSPNKPNFPSCVLKKGETYHHKAEFKFEVE